MHNCRQTRAQLTDLACEELAPDARARVLAETAGCAACQAEYLALAALLRTCTLAKTFAQPPEDFWSGYGARLDARLLALAHETSLAPASAVITPRASLLTTLRRALVARLRVPVPVALAVALALVILSVLALRAATALSLPPAPEAASSAAPVVRVVEVPVVQEKIVTRTVYVTRRDNRPARHVAQPQRADRERLARRSKDVGSEQAARSALAGFQPAGEVKLRVIKGSFTHEQ